MWIKLSEIPSEGLSVNVETPLQPLGLDHEGWSSVSPVRVQLRVSREDDMILVDGEVSAQLQFECNRCLADSPCPVSMPVHLSLIPDEEEMPEGEYQLQAVDLVQQCYRQDGIETNEIVREQVLLAIPMQVLCRPDCRGLCQSCGLNLNERQCHCPGPVENLWSAPLKRLLK